MVKKPAWNFLKHMMTWKTGGQLIITGHIKSYYLHPPFYRLTVQPSCRPTTRYETPATRYSTGHLMVEINLCLKILVNPVRKIRAHSR